MPHLAESDALGKKSSDWLVVEAMPKEDVEQTPGILLVSRSWPSELPTGTKILLKTKKSFILAMITLPTAVSAKFS